MSESNSKNSQGTEQEKRSGGRHQRPAPTNPLGSSPLLSSSAATPPELPAFPPVPSAAPAPAQASFGATHQQQQDPLLYNTQPPASYILRPFEQRHDRQTIYLDARKAGAVDALVELVAKGNKTELVAMMVDDLLTKYAPLLQENAELVQILEEKYRKKHNL